MNHPILYQWEQQLGEMLPLFNSWQRANVALFSYGIVLSHSCQQAAVARAVASGEQVESAARRWRRFLDNDDIGLEDFFQQWSGSVVQALGLSRVTLLVDETKFGQRLGVMMVGLAWEGRCLPLAWRVYRLAEYPTEGQVQVIEQLLRQVQQGLPPQTTVLVLADRGIGTSPELCRGVASMGWHYLFRVTCQTKIVIDSGDYTIAAQVQPGAVWGAEGKIFKQRGRLPAYARALWEVGYEQAWALVTNDPCVTGYEYALRNWQEQSFRDLKSGGWHWGESHIQQPAHMARLLILLSVAYAWMIAVGSQAVALGKSQPLVREKTGKVRRHWSLFKEGVRFFIEVIHRHTYWLDWLFMPDPRVT